MASAAAVKVQIEGALDALVEVGWDVAVHAAGGRASIRMRRGQQMIESEGRTIVEAYMRLLEGERRLEEGVSAEGAAWAMECAHNPYVNVGNPLWDSHTPFYRPDKDGAHDH